MPNCIDFSDKAITDSRFKFNVADANNRVSLGDGNYFGSINISGRDNNVTIEGSSRLSFNIFIKANECNLYIGRNTTMMNVQISFHESGSIHIDEDCMFSGDIRMDVSDMHSILDAATFERFNPPNDIYIGKHVWIAQGVTITKGSIIHDDCIIGAKSLVSGDYAKNTLSVGVPARCIKSNVTWDRKCL